MSENGNDADREERIFKLGPFELWGRRRKTPNEFTELSDAVREFREAVIETIAAHPVRFVLTVLALALVFGAIAHFFLG